MRDKDSKVKTEILVSDKVIRIVNKHNGESIFPKLVQIQIEEMDDWGYSEVDLTASEVDRLIEALQTHKDNC